MHVFEQNIVDSHAVFPYVDAIVDGAHFVVCVQDIVKRVRVPCERNEQLAGHSGGGCATDDRVYFARQSHARVGHTHFGFGWYWGKHRFSEGK